MQLNFPPIEYFQKQMIQQEKKENFKFLTMMCAWHFLSWPSVDNFTLSWTIFVWKHFHIPAKVNDYIIYYVVRIVAPLIAAFAQ